MSTHSTYILVQKFSFSYITCTKKLSTLSDIVGNEQPLCEDAFLFLDSPTGR